MKTIHALSMLTLLTTLFSSGCSEIGANFSSISASENSESVVAEALWVTDAVSVEEVKEKATLIVRARVQSQIERLQTENLPSYGFPEADPSTPLEELDPDQIEQVGEHAVYTPYTETTFEVTKVYKGRAPLALVVSQLGGMMPHPTKRNHKIPLSLEGDPIFTTGSEHILFLTALPGTRTDANTSQIFVVAGPPGRYEVRGEQVIPTVDLGKFAGRPIQAPKTITELEARIIGDSKK